MGTAALIKKIMTIAVPMAVARIINMVSVFLGMIMIARLGHDVLAASALISSAYTTLIVVFMFLLFSVGVVVGQAFGGKRFDEIGDVVQQSFLLSTVLGIPLALLFWFMGDILSAFGQNPHLIVYVAHYFHALVWLAFPLLWLVVLSQFMFAVLKQYHVIVGNVIGVAAFVLSAYAMIYGHWGAPALGVSGLAYAILIQDVVNILFLLGCYCCMPELRRYRIFHCRRQHDWTHLGTLWRVGWPMSIQFGGELVGYFAITVLVGLLSVDELAAWQVVQQIMMIFIVPIFSFAEASAIVIGHRVGAKEHHLVSRVGWLSIGIAMCFVLLGILIFTLMPLDLAHIYMQEQGTYLARLAPMIITLFGVNAAVYFFDSLRNLLSGALRGMYDTRYAMIVGLIVVWVISVCLGYLLAFQAGMGVVGFSIAQAVAFACGAVAVWWRWHTQVE